MRYGSQLDPANSFLAWRAEWDPTHWEHDPEAEADRLRRPIEVTVDASSTIVSKNDSPDIPFNFSVNPYRGCVHGCSYCYARNTHEYLGLNAGLDFETKIFVKPNAAALFREFLSKKSWVCEPIIFSGVTDCYQPLEREYRLTRGLLEVAREFRQPVGIITKNALVGRDLDILHDLARDGLVHVNISVTSLDPELSRLMEPRTSIPAARLRAVKLLADAGVPVRVMTAPIIPGLNDEELPALMQAAKDAGALDVRYTFLRLPKTVAPVFQEWLTRTQPLKAERVEQRIRQSREGALNRSDWGERMRGTGAIAGQIEALFKLLHRKHEFPGLPPYDTTRFQVPEPPSRQMRLF